MQWMGALLLLLCVGAVAFLYRQETIRLLRLAQAWLAYVKELQHRLQQSSLPLSHILAETDENRREMLLGIPPQAIVAPSLDDSALNAFDAMCRSAGMQLPQPCGGRLSVLGEVLSAAVSPQHAAEALDGVSELLKNAEVQLQRQLDERCRLVTALCLCGALGVILLFW